MYLQLYNLHDSIFEVKIQTIKNLIKSKWKQTQPKFTQKIITLEQCVDDTDPMSLLGMSTDHDLLNNILQKGK